MTGSAWRTRRPSVDMVAPPERLAAFRIAASGFTTAYLLLRSPVFLGLADRAQDDFDPVGVLDLFDWRFSSGLVTALVLATPAVGIAATVGWRYRLTGPTFAVGVGLLTTLRSSWGQLLHFENLMLLFALVLAVSPAADAWSLDALRRTRHSTERPADDERSPAPDVRYGHPLVVASWIVVTTYVIAGIAKLRYGGIGWLDGDTLRNHIASAAARLDLLGGTPAPLAELAVRAEVVLPLAAFVTVALELAAPLALIDRRLRNGWVATVWFLHVGVLLTMAIGFPSPLFGVAFAPLFRLEVAIERLRARIRSRGVDGAPA
ncbi:MAG: HTTM domain-containing protein [Actinomycetota bacterium]